VTETPEGTALYRIRGAAGLLLYIGVSDDFGRRWWVHAKTQPWWSEMQSLSADEWYDTREAAEAAEKTAIKAERPKYNKKHNKKHAVTSGPRHTHRWIDGGDSLGWDAPLAPEPPESPERVAVLRTAYRNGYDSLGYP
jgi:predicted GIY-YIG superfamily endonuclease